MKTISSKLVQVMSVVFVLAGIASAAFGQQAYRYTLHLNNYSGYTIDNLYVKSSSESDWHRDLLGAGTLSAPGSFDVTNILPGGYYDVKLVDQDHDSCILKNVYFSESKVFTITQDWLIWCEALTLTAGL